ncbi:MAG: hypothetical protein ACR2N5_02025 [Solirubrobacterales bacterium]
MALVICPRCGMRVFVISGWAESESCPDCRARLSTTGRAVHVVRGQMAARERGTRLPSDPDHPKSSRRGRETSLVR